MNLSQAIKLGGKKIIIHFHDAAYDPAKHPKAPKGAAEGKGGQFVSKNAGGTTSSASAPQTAKQPSETKSKHSPDLVDVGGDEWNKQTAKRLADEYVEAKPELDKLKDEAAKVSTREQIIDEPETANQKWQALPDEVKDDVEITWKSDNNKHIMDDIDYLHPELTPAQKQELVKKTLDKVWDNMNWYEQYAFAADHNQTVKKQIEDEMKSVSGEPAKYDPLNETTGVDYKRTQAIARKMSVDRAVDLLQKRNVDLYMSLKGNPSLLREKVKQIDDKLWAEWKGSSTSDDGYLIQAATADELGGKARGLDIDHWKSYANNEYDRIGGWNGIKAMIRAKWETSQYLLEKAGINKIDVYRGLNLPEAENEPRERVEVKAPDRKYYPNDMGEEFIRLPNVNIQRNGAASTSTDYKVSNQWDGDANRVVLRISAPRTAVLSVPAYGVNVQSEHEVVLAGTAWSAWDAWEGKSALINDLPIGQSPKGESLPPRFADQNKFKQRLEPEGFKVEIGGSNQNMIVGSYHGTDDEFKMVFSWNKSTQEGSVIYQHANAETSDHITVNGDANRMLGAILNQMVKMKQEEAAAKNTAQPEGALHKDPEWDNTLKQLGAKKLDSSEMSSQYEFPDGSSMFLQNDDENKLHKFLLFKKSGGKFDGHGIKEFKEKVLPNMPGANPEPEPTSTPEQTAKPDFAPLPKHKNPEINDKLKEAGYIPIKELSKSIKFLNHDDGSFIIVGKDLTDKGGPQGYPYAWVKYDAMQNILGKSDNINDLWSHLGDQNEKKAA